MPSMHNAATAAQERTMSPTPWRIKADYLENCNCDLLCPCLFAVAPTEGEVVYLHPADKYHRLTHRPSQGQKGLDERAIMTSPWSSPPWSDPRSEPCGRT